MEKIKKITIQKPSIDNSLALFIKSMSEEEKYTPVSKLPKSRIQEYIKALFEFQLEVIPNLEHNASKSFLILLNELEVNQVNKFQLNISFAGTKDEIQEERFNLNIEKSSEHIIQDESEIEKNNSDHPKINLFVNQQEAVIDIFQYLKQQFPMSRESNIALLSSSILSIFEFMSVNNLSKLSCFMDGVIVNGKNSDNNYKIIKLFWKTIRKNLISPIDHIAL